MAHKNHSSVILVCTVTTYHKVTKKGVFIILEIVKSLFCKNRCRNSVIIILNEFIYCSCHFLRKTVNTVDCFIKRRFEISSLEATTFVHYLNISNRFFRIFGCAIANINTKLTGSLIDVIFKQRVILRKLCFCFIHAISVNQSDILDITVTDITGSKECCSCCLTQNCKTQHYRDNNKR